MALRFGTIVCLAAAVEGISMMTKPKGAAELKAGWGDFEKRAMAVVEGHPIVRHNAYCDWFASGAANHAQQQQLVQQFSVFSQLFLIAQLQKIINAPSLEEMREGKEILANEIGVIFKPKNAAKNKAVLDSNGFNPDEVSVEGTVEGGVFSNRAAHFEWLLKVGEPLGLEFNDLGKRRLGTKSTVHFCDELSRLYANEEDSISIGASFAVENWAAAGFWFALIDGFNKHNVDRKEAGLKKLPMGFWTHHAALEQQHADHTIDELRDLYMQGRIVDEEAFFETCNEMLDAVAVFWDGLDEDKVALADDA